MAGILPSAVASPQQLYQGSPGVASLSSALSLSTDSATSSSLAATTYYVQCDYTADAGRTTTGGSQASIAVGTAGEDILTSVSISPSNITGVGVYVGTASNPALLGTISVDGSTITYSGGVTSGLSATVSGGTMSITISAPAGSSGAAAQTSNTTKTKLFSAPSNDTSVPSPVATATVANLWLTNVTGSSASVSLWMVPSGGTPAEPLALMVDTPISANDAKIFGGLGLQVPADATVWGAASPAKSVTFHISGAVIQ